jgi:hypothetical protein
MRASRVLLLLTALLALLLAVASPADAAGSLKPFERPIGPQFITGAIVWALLVGLMLLFILYIGVSCISSIERPVRLSAVPLVIAKEY